MSLQSEELAYDTANIVYKRVGPTYDKWWMKEGYGQNYAWVVAEHSDYSVRLFFEFMDTGFCYVKVHFTNGAAYEDLIADSWNYAKESPEYPFEETCDHVRNFLDNFFEVGGGMDKLRAKYEKGNNMYDVDSYTERDGYVKNSRKPSHKSIKSSDANHTYEEYKGNPFDLEEHNKWFDDNKVNREIAGYFGKENVKRFYNLTAGADVSTDGYCIKLIYPNGDEFDVKSNNGMYELWYIGEDRVMHNLASISHYAPERFLKVLERALPYTQERRDAEDPLKSSRKPVKSDWKREAEFMNDRIRDDNLLYQVFKIEDEHFGGNFENPDNWDGTHIVYTIENGEITNTEIVDSFEDVIDDGNKYYLSANRDTGYRNTDYVLDRVALWQERNNRGITSSRKPVKSSVEGLTFDNKYNDGSNDFVQYKVNNQNILDKIKEYLAYDEDELKLGNVYVTLMYDNNELVAAQVVDTESSTWDLSPEECIEVFGSDIMTNVSDNVGNHAVDEFTDYDVDPLHFVVGKTMKDGSKLYYCEDNRFYDENDYSRPDIKVFDNEVDAKKIAKRSKNGFAMPLEVR